jgi:hypothetical protein
MTEYFLLEDEPYPLHSFKGQPEFAAFDRDNYNVNNDSELPSITFTSTLGINELTPVPLDMGFNY